MTHDQLHALYRFYDAGGALLYVGITADPGARWRKHAHDKPWWHEIANITIETHLTRNAVLEAERAAIIAEQPRHNVVHNRHPAPRPANKRTTHNRCQNQHAWVEPDGHGNLACCDCGHLLYVCDCGGSDLGADWHDYTRSIAGAAPNTGPFGNDASHMPDDCHDHCVQRGIYRIYYPYKWRDGIAHYLCDQGHHWTCGWGHNLSGDAPEHARRPITEDTFAGDLPHNPVAIG